MSNLSDMLLEKLDPIGSKRAKLDEHPAQVQPTCCSCDVLESKFTCRGGHRLCQNCIFPVNSWMCPFTDCPGKTVPVPREVYRRLIKLGTLAKKEEAARQTGANLSHALSSEKTEASQRSQTAQKGQADSRSDVPEASQQWQTAQDGQFDSRSDLPEDSVDLDFIGCQRPPIWTAPADIHRRQGYALVKISPYSLEGQKLLALIPGLPLSSVTGIERLENRDLYESFCLKKRQMARTMSPHEINERDLFTVLTKKLADAVARNGYDFRKVPKGTHRYGQGAEFDIAVNIHETLARGNVLCVSKVLCGSWTKALPNMLCPPERMDGQPFDSCVDSLVNPNVVILYENSQHYPSYFMYLK